MTNQSITVRTIEAAKPCPGRKVYTWDSSLRGFGLRVTPKGVKSFVLQYLVDGGPARRKTIGVHGSQWTTQTARKEAERLLMIVRQGVDPVEAVGEGLRIPALRAGRTHQLTQAIAGGAAIVISGGGRPLGKDGLLGLSLGVEGDGRGRGGRAGFRAVLCPTITRLKRSSGAAINYGQLR